MSPLIFRAKCGLDSDWTSSFEADGFQIQSASAHRVALKKNGDSVEVRQFRRPDLGDAWASIIVSNETASGIRERAELICVVSGWRPVAPSVWLLGMPIADELGDTFLICGDGSDVLQLCESLKSDPYIELRRRDELKGWRSFLFGPGISRQAHWVAEWDCGSALQGRLAVRWIFLRCVASASIESLEGFSTHLREVLGTRRLEFMMINGQFQDNAWCGPL